MTMRLLLVIALLWPHGPAVAPLLAQEGGTELGREMLKDRINPGDAISISIIPGEEYSREVVVQPDGKIQMPLIGSLYVKGLTVPELEVLLEQRYGKYVANPQVTANVKMFKGRRVAIIGEVKTPGFYDYRDGMRLLELVSLAGGLGPDARTSRVKILRADNAGGKERSFSCNFQSVLDGDMSRDPALAPGDTIHIPQKPFTRGATWVNRNLLPWALLTSMVATIIVATKPRR